MREFALFIRFVGICLGLFFITSSIADIAGLLPHSEETPPFIERLVSNLIPLFFGSVLLVPHRWCKSKLFFYSLFSSYVFVVGAIGYKLADSYSLIHSGVMDPSAMPFLMLIFGIPLLNAIVLWLYSRPQAMPN